MKNLHNSLLFQPCLTAHTVNIIIDAALPSPIDSKKILAILDLLNKINASHLNESTFNFIELNLM